MEQKNKNTIQFQPDGLLRACRKEVSAYFAAHDIATTGNIHLYVKACIMLLLWLIPYALPFFTFISLGGMVLLGIVCGIGNAGVGMNIMHDANHDTFFKNKKWNKFLGRIIGLQGGFAHNWKWQHNQQHHTHTNIHNHDHDIDTRGIFRFTKNQPLLKRHRFQFLYALPLYTLMTWEWLGKHDFKQLNQQFQNDAQYLRKRKLLRQLILSKILYFVIWLIIPMIFWNDSFWYVLVFFSVMHCTSGLILSLIFQMAHVVPRASMHHKDETLPSWFKHQLATSCNFGTKRPLLRWFCGGLTHQKEHHLFPNISHVHYVKIENILRSFCERNNIEYSEYATFRAAILDHLRLLYRLGRPAIH